MGHTCVQVRQRLPEPRAEESLEENRLSGTSCWKRRLYCSKKWCAVLQRTGRPWLL